MSIRTRRSKEKHTVINSRTYPRNVVPKQGGGVVGHTKIDRGNLEMDLTRILGGQKNRRNLMKTNQSLFTVIANRNGNNMVKRVCGVPKRSGW